ncbi:3'-5' exonuclease [Hydrogenovibrio sp. 3SP14C1]|uniref:3'-5' exonuclease n=1 Tax=Hydrogenovibrio sp. 3SP14C1 TaxID=3038774 RepID=UPI002416109A|nr:3'-5' exonuclease [Hydrogenovibrio sp. 3SP14C1]MDG4813208.1 3'-5' exonuclease [Hydrogenovibrio sp. 3SP14C1]
MSNAQLIFIDKRNQPIKEYIVAVAASDGLNIKGIQIIASPAKGEKALISATVKIPPLEDLQFDTTKIVNAILDQLVVGEETLSVKELIERASEEDEVRKSLSKSVKKLKSKLTDLIKEFTGSEVINLIQERRNDANFKLKEHDQELKGNKVVCIDIEATDICTKDNADIIQVSICDLEGNELLNQLINPGYDIPENDKHNICTEMVQDAPFLADAWEEIHRILAEADTVLAYSTESDFAYLEKSAEKKMLTFELDYNKWLDVAELSKDLVGALRWQSEKMYWFYKTPKLTDAYEKIMGTPFPGDAHDALADAQATAELFNAMLVRGRKSQVKIKKPEPVKDEISNNPFAQAFAAAKRKSK